MLLTGLRGALLFGALCACRREQAPTAGLAKPPEATPQAPARIGIKDLRLPLRVAVGGTEVHGEAMLARVQVGAGKRGGGLFAVLSPALRVDGALVETDGDNLSVLADLPVALRMLVKMDAIEFRGLLVRDRDGKTLLECSSASVSKEGVWEMRHVRRNGGIHEAVFRIQPGEGATVPEGSAEDKADPKG
jgi:hypothetical protein